MRDGEANAARIDRLVHAANVAERLRPVLNDPAVSAALERIERELLEAVIAAEAHDREAAVAQVKAWRLLRSALGGLTLAGPTAIKKLNQLADRPQGAKHGE